MSKFPIPDEALTSHTAILGKTGSGKALALNTPLPTPSGWTTMGDVRVGDLLIDENGCSCTVTFATEVQRDRQCFVIRFSDGSEVVADADHQWLSETDRSRLADANAHAKSVRGFRSGIGRDGRPQCSRRFFPEVVTTAMMAQTLGVKRKHGVRRNHAIRNAKALRLPNVDLPIDPYVLGCWLGDGTSASASITTADPEVLVFIAARGFEVGPARKQPVQSRSRTYGIKSGIDGIKFAVLLRRSGLLKNKRIPEIYLRSSADQRLALLRGLMDTDGSVQSGSNSCIFYNTNRVLADGVYELVCSLGWAATFRTKRARLNGVDHGECFEIRFRPSENVFLLDRKLNELSGFSVSQELRSQRRYVIDIVPVPSVPVRCIQVDSPSHLFLCSKSFIPTHNTSTEKLIVEHAVDGGLRVCVLDTLKSDWWGITSSASGQRAGLPFKILGGPRGHVPLHSSAGKVIGQLVGSGKLPLSIIDMADFEAGGIQRFFVDFAQALWRHVRGVVYLVIEEAHEIAPKERAGFGQENMAIHWAKKLATGSRTKGIRLIVASQRVQALHNAVLGSCETLIAHRVTLDADQKPIVDWLKNADKTMVGEVSESLSSLPTGTGWVCSGEAKVFERVAFPKFHTYDNTVTPTGDAAADIDVKMAPVDQDELRSLIGDAVKEAEATDVRALQAKLAARERRIAELERAGPQPGAPDPAAIQAAEQRGFDQAKTKLAAAAEKELRARIGAIATALRTAGDGFASEVKTIIGSLAGPADLRDAVTFTPAPAAALPRAAPSVPPRPPSGAKPSTPHEGIDRPLQTILDSIRWWNVMGIAAPSQAQVAFVAGYSHKSGTWATYLSRLRSGALIDGRGDLTLTAEGATVVNEPGTPPTGEHLRAAVMGKIDAPLQRILSPLIESFPNGLSQEEAGQKAGYSHTSGTWATYLSRLRSLDLIEGRGELRAQRWLFP